MTHRVVFLESAQADLKDIRRYIVAHFNQNTWVETYTKLKQTIRNLSDFPLTGPNIHELRELNMTQFRQVISGADRVVYERRDDAIYIHLICDTRKDLVSLLHSRLLRFN
jgi:toxin ParE1/3/4